ncbi:MAG: S1 RNA-binding domain-containing protein [Ignavibacteriae bacterium]|nr:S1 RNA-binding domain-containing protein [Ignavibacteriota bacterium]
MNNDETMQQVEADNASVITETTEATQQQAEESKTPEMEIPDVNAIDSKPETQEVAVETVTENAEQVQQKSEELVTEKTGTEVQSEANADEAREEKRISQRQQHYDRIMAEILEIKEKKGFIEITLNARIKGGMRVIYKDVPMFLPTSHFALKRTPSEQEMQASVGQKVKAMIHEIQEYEEGKKAVIVSRKKILLDEFWNKINVGDIVEGRVTSVASFGVFVDIGGVEGLIHISRLSKIKIDDPSKYFKKGDVVRSAIIEIDKEKNKIALSRKELEDSPWKNAEELFVAGTQHNGRVRRTTDFGVYVELKPGVDGLIRSSELSWTKRIKQPSDLLSPGMEIMVEILSVNEEKQNISLSYKRTQPNTWLTMIDRFPVGVEVPGVVVQVMPQGAIVSISEDVDGFMPRSKMRQLMRGKKIPFKSGDTMNVIIADVNPDEESLILAPVVTEELLASTMPPRNERRQQPRREESKVKPSGNGSFSLEDLLSDNAKEKLNNISK